MRQPSRKTNIVMWQGGIIAISLVTALAPQYFWLFFILYFIIIMGFMLRSSRKMSKIPPRSELGNILYKEPQAIKIALLDKKLSDELKQQFKLTMMMLGLTFVALILFSAYRALAFAPIHSYLSSIIENEVLVLFLDYLIMYEIITGILSLPRFAMWGKMATANIMLAQKFTVYRKGVIVNDRFYIPFSNEQCYVYEPKRRFIEIRSMTNKGMRLRLYTESISSLMEKIKSLGLKECILNEAGQIEEKI